MPTFTYPGVYIEEIPSGVHTITGVATSIAAFVGWAAQGPTREATLVQSWQDFASQFGGLDSRSYLGYAVNQFFANGGQQAYIVRLTDGTDTPAELTIGGLVFDSSAAPSPSTVTIIPTEAGAVPDWQASTAYTVGTLVKDSGGGVERCASAGSSSTTQPAWPTTLGTKTIDDAGINPWAASTAYTTGTLVTDSNGKVQKCTTAGTSGAAAPTWQTAVGATTTDATVVWTLIELATWELVATSVPTDGLTLSAANSGTWGENYSIQIQPRPDDYTRFSLSVIYTNPTTKAQSTVESYANLSLSASDSQYVVNVINESSSYLSASMGSPALAITQVPAAPSAPLPSAPTTPVSLSGGGIGAVLQPTATAGSPGAFETALLPVSGTGGVNLLRTVPIFNILCVPGEIDPQTIQELQAFCVDERAFMVVDSEQHATFTSLQNGPSGLLTGVNAINSALYFPWVNAFDPQMSLTRPFPPCGFVSGIYAATDASRSVWKAPAGIDASLTGESGLAVTLTDLQNGTLNVQGINCLRNFRVYGDVVWGARTLRGNDQVGSEWKYVPIRRFALFLESSLYDGTQWVVFEPNDETLWGQIRLNVGAFMQGLFLQGAFAGSTPQKAYFVKCDGENNPPPSVAQGIVNILVGFAPLYPAEFVVIQIQQIALQA